MLRLAGTSISDDDARRLIATLVADGRRDTVEAAQQIGRTMARRRTVVPLTTKQRDAILAVLHDQPAGLAELRDALARDHGHRSTT